MCGKLSELHCNATLVSNREEKVMKWRKTVGQICPVVYFAFQTFSPGFKNNKTSKFGSESFPHMMTYMLRVENCQSNILSHSCLPIAGRLFYNVRKFHRPTIWECTLGILGAEKHGPVFFMTYFDNLVQPYQNYYGQHCWIITIWYWSN